MQPLLLPSLAVMALAAMLSALFVPVVSGLAACPWPRSAMLSALAGLMAAWTWAAVVVADGWLVPSMILAWALMVLACVDLMVWRLPDAVTFPLAGGGVAVAMATPDPFPHIVGALVGYGAFWVLAWGYRRFRKREGLGLGDAKLLSAAGAWLGWQGLPSTVLIASLLALTAIGGGRLLRTSAGGTATFSAPVPFGPALCAATWGVWLYGPVSIAT